MKKHLLAALFILLATAGATAQQNGLDFDGFDDYVSVPGGSALIANQAGFSMSCWVYPTNANPAFPNFDGIVGFRNETNADFYILHLSTTSWECRFRGTSGAYTITSPTVQLNTWQHVALVYAGTTLKFYHNGTLATSIPITGSLTNTAVDFSIGYIPFQTTPFWTTGQIDEVALWSKALSDTDVNCIYRQAINPATPGLAAYYPMNQGVAGGNNFNITFLDDVQSVTYDGFVNGFALSGTTSNFVSGVSRVTPVSDTMCAGDTYSLAGQTFTQAGEYTIFTGGGPESCDSAIALSLAVEAVDNGISQIGATFTATDSTATYQWVNCAGYVAVAGQTSRSFTATANGSYAVIVTTSRGCSDTSVCLPIATISVEETSLAAHVRVFPNPGRVLAFEINDAPAALELEIRSVTGSLLQQQKLENGSYQFDNDAWPAGVYLLQFRSKGIFYTTRWVKQP